MKLPELAPDQEAELIFIPDFQDTPFTIRDVAANLAPLAEELIKQDERRQVAPKAVETPKAVPKPELAYVDFSALPSRQIARMKVSAWLYDRQHKTDMLALLNERIDNDRDVAFARGLGLLSVTRCQKHEKAVAKLRGML